MNFTVRINDRRIPEGQWQLTADLKKKDYDSVFITLDKMDKIGLDGVAAELEGKWICRGIC